jgi:hypothetical protein
MHASSAVVLAYARPDASAALTGGRRNRLETLRDTEPLRDSETCLQDIDVSLYFRKLISENKDAGSSEWVFDQICKQFTASGY